VLSWIAAGAVVLVVWVVVEQRVAHPLIHFSAFAGRGGLGVPILMAALFGAQLFGSQTPLAIFLGTPREVGFGLGLAPGAIGWVLFAWAAAMFVGTVLGPRLTARTEAATAIVVGSVLTAAAQFLLLAAHETTGVVLAWLIISGVGNGIIVAVLPDMVVHRAATDSVGIASGLYNTARTVAGAVAAAAFTAVMSGHLLDLGGGTIITDETGYEIVWAICGVLVLCVGLLAPLARRRSTRATPAPALAGATAADS
jgi:predicted MFS family arabinose efflux permease